MSNSIHALDLAPVKNRMERGEQYLLALERLQNRRWSEVFGEYSERRLATPEVMVLVHPTFYEHLGADARQSIQGPRRFPHTADQRAKACMAEQIWFSACPLENAEDVHSDHVFPYSLGGPTVAANQLFLCPVHNRAKAGDIHLFPWERGEPSWLAGQVDRICRFLL